MEAIFRSLAFGILLIAPLAVAAATASGGFLWFATGAIAWGISVALKILLAKLLHRGLGDATSLKVRGTAHGTLSAACELGCAAVCFLWLLADGNAWNAASFGAGAGWIEIVALLAAYILSDNNRTLAEELPWHVRWTFLVERAGAVLGHVGSRGLVWLAIQRSPWFAVPAVAGFAIVDGLAVYGTIRKWDWLEWRTWSWFYGVVMSVSLVELSLFIMFASQGNSHTK